MAEPPWGHVRSLTLVVGRDDLLEGARVADALDEHPIVRLRREQHSVDEIAVVGLDSDEGHLVSGTAPARAGESEDALGIGSMGPSAEDAHDFGPEEGLHVPTGADVDHGTEGLGAGILAHGMLVWSIG